MDIGMRFVLAPSAVIPQDLHERIRDVRQGPDGALHLLTDNSAGRVLRIAPVRL